MSQVKMLKVSEIKESPVALRTVDTSSEKFTELVDSIKRDGLLNSVSVRSEGDQFMLVDGLHRLYASRQAGLEEIPCIILDINEAETLAAQIMANVHKIDTKPVEYSEQIRKMLAAHRTMTVSELGEMLSKSPSWINERLGLLKLGDRAKELVNSDAIPLANAYALAKLPFEEQESWLDRAQTMPTNEFVDEAAKRRKELQKQKREGRSPNPEEFTAIPRLRKLSEIKAAAVDPTLAANVCAVEGAGDSTDGFLAGVKWCLNLDKDAIDSAKAKWEARQAKKVEDAEKRKVERLQKQAEEAAAKLKAVANDAE